MGGDGGEAWGRGGPGGAARLARVVDPLGAGRRRTLLDQGLDFVKWATLARNKAMIVRQASQAVLALDPGSGSTT